MALSSTFPDARKAVPFRCLPRSPWSARRKAAASCAVGLPARRRIATSIPRALAMRSSTSRPDPRRPWMAEPYLRDGAAIYERSFAIIRAEADLSRFTTEEAEVAIRMIHACGLVEAAEHFVFGHDLVSAARAALRRGAPILCDAEMVAHGITQARLPARNEIFCALRDPSVLAIAKKLGTTRSAAALELWGDKTGGAVVAIGNAPTALFRLLEVLDA